MEGRQKKAVTEGKKLFSFSFFPRTIGFEWRTAAGGGGGDNGNWARGGERCLVFFPEAYGRHLGSGNGYFSTIFFFLSSSKG